MSNPEKLQNRLNGELDDGPFGPVEFKAYVEQDSDGEYSVFISHLLVHKEYREQGLGRRTITSVAEMSKRSTLNVNEISIDIDGGSDSATFLEEVGFSNIREHGTQVSGVASISDLLES